MDGDGITTDGMVRQLWARQQIQDCVLRFSRGCDRCDQDIIRSAYHADGWDDHGEFKGPAGAFAEWADHFHRTICTGTAHNIVNHLVEFDPDNPDIAYAESYVIGWLRTPTTDIVGMGRYLDRFECRKGQWRIALRKTVLDWQRVDPIGNSPLNTLGIAPGLRSRDDDSYRFLPSGRAKRPDCGALP